MAVAQGSKPSQLDVTVSSTIDNVFGAAFGKDTTTITRHAIADYTGPHRWAVPATLWATSRQALRAPDRLGPSCPSRPGATCTSSAASSG